MTRRLKNIPTSRPFYLDSTSLSFLFVRLNYSRLLILEKYERVSFLIDNLKCYESTLSARDNIHS